MRNFILLLLAAAVFSGCSSEQQTEESSSTDTDQPRTIEIMAVDQMKYVVESEGELLSTAEPIETSAGDSYLLLENIEASPGESIQIRLTAISELPPNAMSHNWVLLNSGVDPNAFAQAAIPAGENDHIPADRSDDIIAHTALAAGGETVEVTFTVPEETGEYDYLCSFPAHFTGGMTGKLIVQ